MSEIWYINPVIVVRTVITHKMFDAGQKFDQQQIASWKFSLVYVGEEVQYSNHLHVHSLQSLCQPTKMYCRYSWRMKNTWCFFYIYSVNDLSKSNWRNSISSLVSLWAIFLQDAGTNGCYFLFQAQSLTLQSHPSGQHENWPFLPDLHQKCDGRNFSYT